MVKVEEKLPVDQSKGAAIPTLNCPINQATTNTTSIILRRRSTTTVNTMMIRELIAATAGLRIGMTDGRNPCLHARNLP